MCFQTKPGKMNDPHFIHCMKGKAHAKQDINLGECLQKAQKGDSML